MEEDISLSLNRRRFTYNNPSRTRAEEEDARPAWRECVYVAALKKSAIVCSDLTHV